MAITLLVLNGLKKILSLLEREVNVQQIQCKTSVKPVHVTSHHTFSVLPHYLVKVRSSNSWQFPKKNNLKIVSLLTKTETYFVIWLTIVTIYAQVSAFCPQTYARTYTLLVNCIDNDGVVSAMPHMQKTLLQFTTFA